MNVNQFSLKFTTDLDKGITLTPLNQAFLQDDHKAHVFTIKTTRGGAANSLENATIKGFFLPSAANSVAIELDGERNTDGEAVITLTQDCYAYAGRFYLIVQAIADGMKSSIFYAEGYVSKTRTDSVIEPSGAVPSLSALEERINNLTYADVGAAPAGYGLGVRLTKEIYTAENVDAFSVGGAARFYDGANYSSLVPNMPEGYDCTIVNIGSDPYLLQLAIARTGTIVAVRHYRAGVFGEWEWVNPPMVLGVEYRTTERWNGKPVYTVLTNCGVPGAEGEKTISTIIPLTATVIRHSGTLDKLSLPFYYEYRDYMIRTQYNNGTDCKIIELFGHSDYKDFPVYEQAWYVKG